MISRRDIDSRAELPDDLARQSFEIGTPSLKRSEERTP